jgi:hypothetical protein
MKEKQQWQKPQLIGLARSRPEEAVLMTCKLSGSGTGVGASTSVSACTIVASTTWRTSCTTSQCSSRTGS